MERLAFLHIVNAPCGLSAFDYLRAPQVATSGVFGIEIMRTSNQNNWFRSIRQVFGFCLSTRLKEVFGGFLPPLVDLVQRLQDKHVVYVQRARGAYDFLTTSLAVQVQQPSERSVACLIGGFE